jgi:hypothetical protein
VGQHIHENQNDRWSNHLNFNRSNIFLIDESITTYQTTFRYWWRIA